MKQMDSASLATLRTLVEEVLTVIANDDVGITHDLIDITLQAGEILGLEKEEMENLESRTVQSVRLVVLRQDRWV